LNLLKRIEVAQLASDQKAHDFAHRLGDASTAVMQETRGALTPEGFGLLKTPRAMTELGAALTMRGGAHIVDGIYHSQMPKIVTGVVETAGGVLFAIGNPAKVVSIVRVAVGQTRAGGN
jgi:hypothetical protein